MWLMKKKCLAATLIHKADTELKDPKGVCESRLDIILRRLFVARFTGCEEGSGALS